MASPGEPPARVRPFVFSIAALAGVALAAWTWLLVADPAQRPDPSILVAAPFFLVVFAIVHRSILIFHLRGQGMSVALDEGFVMLALLTMGPAATVWLVGGGSLVTQLYARRSPIKTTFNVATHTLAASGGALVMLATQALGYPPLLGALPAIVVHSIISNALVGALFIRLGTPSARRQPFALPVLVQVGIGSGLGVTLYGLWLHHPVATIAVFPFAYLAWAYTSLLAQAERKVVVHRRLAEVTHGLVGTLSLEEVADRVLATCEGLFRAGAAELHLKRHDGNTIRLGQEFEGGRDASRPPLEAAILGGAGKEIGTLRVFASNRTRERYGESEREILRIVASQAAIAMENALALREKLEQQRLAIERLSEIERLTEVSRLKTELLSTASHELNTPITPVKLQVHLLRSGKLGALTEPQSRAVDLVDRNLDRLKRLVADVLDVGRLQGGKLSMKRAPADLAVVLQETLDSFEPAATQAGITLERDVPATLPLVGDAHRLTQVLVNLVSNALKYTPPGGVVRVTAHHDANGLVLRVRDSGVGLDAAQIESLFQPFAMVQGEEQKEGNGLGLYISRGIAEQHGGSLACESAGRGMGATFVLKLPDRNA